MQASRPAHRFGRIGEGARPGIFQSLGLLRRAVPHLNVFALAPEGANEVGTQRPIPKKAIMRSAGYSKRAVKGPGASPVPHGG